jgi:acetyltransferase EpsM
MKIVILGSGTTAKSVYNILNENKGFQIVGFIGSDADANKYENNDVVNKVPFLGTFTLLEDLLKNAIEGFIVAVGDNTLREKIYYRAIKHNLIPVSAISRNAIIAQSALIDRGTIIKPGCIIGHDVKIRQNTKIDSGSIIEINSEVESNCTIGASVIINGECKIKKNVTIGSRVTISSYLTIGKNQIIDDGLFIKENLIDLERKDS